MNRSSKKPYDKFSYNSLRSREFPFLFLCVVKSGFFFVFLNVVYLDCESTVDQ